MLVARRARALRVGVLLPLSGADAAIGRGVRNAIRLAADELNDQGGIQGRMLLLSEVDDESDPEKAAQGAGRLGADPRVLAVLTSVGHATYRKVQPILGDARTPFLSPGAIDRDVSTVGLHAFPTEAALIPYGTTQQEKMVAYAWDVLGARRFFYVREDTDFALSVLNHFRVATAARLDALQTQDEPIGADAAIPASVARIKAAAPDYVFYSGRPAQAALLLTQLRQAGVNSPFQHAWLEPSQEFIDRAADKAEGSLAVFPGLPAEASPEGRAFLQAYAAKGYRDPPSRFGLFGYAGAKVLFAAMARSFLSRPSITGALSNGQFDSPLGPIRFNWVGSTYQTAGIYKVVHGQWTPVYMSGKAGVVPFVAQ